MLKTTNLIWNSNKPLGLGLNCDYIDWNQSLVTRINEGSADIHKNTIHGGANIIKVATNTQHIFDTICSFDRHRMKMGNYKVFYDESLVSCLQIFNQNDENNFRIIEIHGLAEEPYYPKSYDLMYVLIGR